MCRISYLSSNVAKAIVSGRYVLCCHFHISEAHRLKLYEWFQVFDEDMNECKSWNSATDKQKRFLRPSMWKPSKDEAKWMNLQNCARILPHDNDTHGIFFAVIEKVGEEEIACVGPSLSVNTIVSKPKKVDTKVASKRVGVYNPIKKSHFESLAAFYGLQGVSEDNFVEHLNFSKGQDFSLVTTEVSKV